MALSAASAQMISEDQTQRDIAGVDYPSGSEADQAGDLSGSDGEGDNADGGDEHVDEEQVENADGGDAADTDDDDDAVKEEKPKKKRKAPTGPRLSKAEEISRIFANSNAIAKIKQDIIQELNTALADHPLIRERIVADVETCMQGHIGANVSAAQRLLGNNAKAYFPDAVEEMQAVVGGEPVARVAWKIEPSFVSFSVEQLMDLNEKITAFAISIDSMKRGNTLGAQLLVDIMSKLHVAAGKAIISILDKDNVPPTRKPSEKRKKASNGKKKVVGAGNAALAAKNANKRTRMT